VSPPRDLPKVPLNRYHPASVSGARMRRREFIAGFGSVAAWPRAARAQRSGVPVIGFLSSGSPAELESRIQAFQRGLSGAGYEKGVNVEFEFRWAENDSSRLRPLAAELVGRGPAMIVTTGAVATSAAKAATSTIPIVFYVGGDPVRLGLVNSLPRPGGNLTGIVNFAVEVAPKRLEFLHELIPAGNPVGVLVNPATAETSRQLRDLQTAARNLKLELHVVHAGTERDIDAAFATFARVQARGLVIAGDLFFSAKSDRLAALALRHRLPAAFQFREFAAAGGLLSYGGSFTDMYDQLGVYAARILKGETPAGLPVQQGTKAELILNLKTAKALGLNVPLALLGRADEVIE
jgi:putative tryptophan/tyrosine transport system substrate-binding protein